MVLAREAFGLAGNVGQKWQVIPVERLRRGRRHPVLGFERQVHPLVPFADIIRAESGPLQVLPVHLERHAAAIDPVARDPEAPVLPRRVGRHPPGAERAPVVHRVHPRDLVAIVEDLRVHIVGVVPPLPEATRSELLGLPPDVLLLHLGEPIDPVSQELCAPLRQAELPRDLRAAEGSLPLVPSPVHRPIPHEGRPVLAQEHRLHALRGPVLEPVGHLLDRHEVGIEIARVHRPQVARRVVIDHSPGIQTLDDRLHAACLDHVLPGPFASRISRPIDHIRVHVLAVARRVVACGVGHDRRMVAGHAREERRVMRIAVGLVRVGIVPIVVAEVRLGKGDQHAHVVRGSQDLREAQMGPRLTAVVVGVHEVDPGALQTLQAFAGPLVARQRRTDLRIVQRHGRQEDPAPVETEIPSLDPELTETESPGVGDIDGTAISREKRELERVGVLGRMDVPELLRPPSLREGRSARLQIGGRESLAGEFRDAAPVGLDGSVKGVRHIRLEVHQTRLERDLPLAHRGVHPYVVDPRAGRPVHEEKVPAQPAPVHLALHFSGRRGVVVRKHHALQRHGHNAQTEHVGPTRHTHLGEIHLTPREPNLANHHTVDMNHGVGVHVFRVEHDPTSRPILRNRDLPLVPRRLDPAQILVLPVGVRVDRLGVLLHVASDPRPGSGYLEVAPAAVGRRIGLLFGRLPAPQAVDAHALASGRPLAERPVQVPHHLDTRWQFSHGRPPPHVTRWAQTQQTASAKEQESAQSQ